MFPNDNSNKSIRIYRIIISRLVMALLFSFAMVHPGYSTTTSKHKINHHVLKSCKKKQIHKKNPLHQKKIQHKKILPTKKSPAVSSAGTTCLPGYLLNEAEKNLVHFVKKSIANVRHNAYKMGGAKIDTRRGIYIVDCSRYVDYVLKNTYPHAFYNLTAWSGNERPTTRDFYHYFINLSDNATHWRVIENVENLRPGDILVFRNKTHRLGGHVMIVMDKPIREKNIFLVRIADAAPAGHSMDTRAHGSGIGVGTFLIKTHPHTKKPDAYAWRMGSQWKHNVKFAMARPQTHFPGHFPGSA